MTSLSASVYSPGCMGAGLMASDIYYEATKRFVTSTSQYRYTWALCINYRGEGFAYEFDMA